MSRVAVSGRIARVEYQNRLAKPEAFDNAAWTKTNCTITPDQIANPIDGTVNADLLVDSIDAITTSHFISIPATLGTDVKAGMFECYSIYAKTTGVIMATSGIGQPHTSQLAILGNNTVLEIIYDLTNGTANTSATTVQNFADFYVDYGIEACSGLYGVGWFRCWMSFGRVSQGGGRFSGLGGSNGGGNSHQGSGENLMYLYGAQISHGRTPSPYLPGRTTLLDIGTPRNRNVVLSGGTRTGRVAVSGRVPV